MRSRSWFVIKSKKTKKSVHDNQAPINQTSVKCDDCFEEFNSIAEMIQHIEVDHSQSANKHCEYRKTMFLSFEKYQNHMNIKHGLPVWSVANASSSLGSNEPEQQLQPRNQSNLKPTQTALNRNRKKFQINVDEDEIDLLDFMMRKQEIIDKLFFYHTQHGSLKVQLSFEVSLMKHVTAEQEEITFEKNMLYLNTEMVRVDYGGLEKGKTHGSD